MVGKTLGPYKIIEQLGAGGMGEVYLGEDTRLGRKVAIKVLPAEFASDAERLARFEQEARAAAALNHPHIAVVHDVGSEREEDGTTTHFMVQEYLEGQSLRERLEKGALDVGAALELADEMSEALVAAHKAGIVHRDLKPDNIFITNDNHIKVLDFGLAKLTEAQAPSASSASMSPTLLGTVAGQVMGTAGYMAPEQVGGEEVDARADVFAFGAVLYEMVTGRRAFVGESVVQTLSMIAHEEPAPLHDIVPTAPTDLGRIVRKCLAKPPPRRYQATADLSVDLRQLREDVAGGVAEVAGVSGAGAMAAGGDSSASRSGLKLAAVAGVTAIVSLAAGLWIGGQMNAVGGSENTATVRSSIPVDPAAHIRRLLLRTMAFTPDGEELVFAAVGDDETRRLYRRRLDAATSTPIAGTEGGVGPEVSPNGEWVLFWADGALNKIPLAGGEAEVLRDLTEEAIDRTAVTWDGLGLGNGSDIAFGATWDGNDSIVYARFQGGLWRIPASGGGEPQSLTTLDGEEEGHRTPVALPGGGILFTVVRGTFLEDARIDVIAPSGERKQLIADGSNPRFVAPDVLLFARQGALVAVRFDLEALEIVGNEERLLPDVAHEIGPSNPVWASGVAQFAATPGSVAFLPGGKIYRCIRADIVWASGAADVSITTEGAFTVARLSPDEERILAMRTGGNLVLVDPDDGSEAELGEGIFPVWEPDGEGVVFSKMDGTTAALYRMAADGSSAVEEVLTSPHFLWASSLDSSGRFLAYIQSHPTTGQDIWLLDLDGEFPPRELHASNFDETHPMISPDGNWLAFVSNKSGEDRVYVERFPEGGLEYEASAGPGSLPSWSSTGDALYFTRRDTGTWRVTVDPTRANPASGSVPEHFSPTAGGWTSPVGWKDVTSDGTRALTTVCQDNIPEMLAAQMLGQIELLQGWRSAVLQGAEGQAGGR